MKLSPHPASCDAACGQWTYYGGAATCPHGYELLPDGVVRLMPLRRWKSHRKVMRLSTVPVRGDVRHLTAVMRSR